MGGCGSKSEKDLAAAKLDAEIAAQARADHEADQAKIKLLLLGAGESGKSTIFKQMKILYGTGFREEDRRQQVPVMHSNVISSMNTLIAAAEELELPVQAQGALAAMKSITEDELMSPEVAGHIATLWADKGIKETYQRRSEFQLNDSAAYFIERAGEICKPDYVPDIKDVLKVRVRTSGIVEEEYIIDGVTFVMVDVGGQRNERKKWIHSFDSVTAVIFVAAISEYDQVLFEDATQNRMVESLNLFHEVCHSRWFENTSIILFLNKRDLFEEKIKEVDIRQRDPADEDQWLFDDYTGGCDYEAAVSYIVQKYLALGQTKGTGTASAREIYWHVTCATDTGNISTVFNACKEIILKQSLQGSGFMD